MMFCYLQVNKYLCVNSRKIEHLGYKARSWMSWQIPIITDGPHGTSRISKINKKKILNFINTGGIPIISGFQGVNLR